jgi:CheY-like chemotaxis protein
MESECDHRPRVLVVEDVLLVAMDIEQTLQGAGYEVVGPVGRLRQAVDLATHEQIDAALLDLDLRGALSTPVAYALRRRGIPFAFVTGHAHTGVLPADLANEPMLDKPLSERGCLAAVAALLAGDIAVDHKTTGKTLHR